MLSCRQASERVSQSFERRLSRGERLRLWLHLAACRGCRRLAAQVRFLHAAVRRLEHECENNHALRLSPAARERIQRTLGRGSSECSPNDTKH